MRETQPVRHLVAYVFCRALFAALALLPRRAGQAFGRGCGLVFYVISPRHRRIALGNLRTAFGETRSNAWRKHLARASFAHAGMILADAAYFRRVARRPLEEVAVYEGVEHLRAANANSPSANFQGWKDRAIWSNYGTHFVWHMEGGKGTKGKEVRFQVRPNPLAR